VKSVEKPLADGDRKPASFWWLTLVCFLAVTFCASSAWVISTYFY